MEILIGHWVVLIGSWFIVGIVALAAVFLLLAAVALIINYAWVRKSRFRVTYVVLAGYLKRKPELDREQLDWLKELCAPGKLPKRLNH